jgi:hypothetical protein
MTGIAASLSTSRVTSDVSAKARVTWPTTPASLITGAPSTTPCWLPRSRRPCAKRVGRFVHHFGLSERTGTPGARFQQRAQAFVFLGQLFGACCTLGLAAMRARAAVSSAWAWRRPRR